MLRNPHVRTAGRLLFTPLVLVLTGFAITVLLVRDQQHRQVVFETHRFETEANAVAQALARRVNGYEYGLRGARGAVTALGDALLDRERFAAYSASRDIDREFPGARGFGFIRRVPAAGAASFEAAAAADGWPGFSVRQLAPHDGERFVIQYIEPVARNRAAVGLDIASERNRREAAMAAIRLDRATITEPITLVQVTGAVNRAFLILLPAYRPGLPLGSFEQREQAAWGWSYAPLVLDDMLDDLLRASPHINWSVMDMSDDGGEAPVFTRTVGPAAGPAEGLAPLTIDVPIFNRIWRLRAEPTTGFVESLPQSRPHLIVGAGTAVTLLAVLLSLLAGRTRRRERDTLAAKTQLAAVVEHATQAVVGEDTQGRVMLWNQAASALFGLTPAQVMGRSLDAVLAAHGATLSEVPTGPDRAPAGAAERLLTQPGGAHRVLLESSGPLLTDDGERLGRAVLLQDITERRAMEDALARSNETLELKVQERTAALAQAEAFLQTVLDSVPSAICYWGIDGRVRAANEAFLRWRGGRRDTVAGRPIAEWLPPEEFEGLQGELDQAWQGQTCVTTFRALDTKSGRWRHFQGRLVPDLRRGRVEGLYFIADDTTDLVQSRSALEVALVEQAAERSRLASIIEGTNVGTWEWNVQTGETRFNERWAEIVGHRLADLAPVNIDTWMRLAHPDDLQRSGELLQAHFRGETPFYDCEARMRHRDGHWVWVLDRGRVATWTPDGQPEWMFGTHQDITRRREMEEALRAAKLLAESTSSAKSQFLANMSHEIRTPLNAVLGMHRLLERTTLDARQREMLVKADKAGHSLLDILNDVLDLAKIEAGEMSLHPQVFDLQDLLDELGAIYAPSAGAKGLNFAAQIAGTGSCWIEADRLRLRQVLANLVGNAIKFTARGSVRLLAQIDRSGATEQLRFSVRDSGIGIEPAAIDRLFNPFMQADDTTSRRFGGSGLGLSIVRNLVELMGGRVAVQSTPGQGSEFTVSMPLRRASEQAVADLQRASRRLQVGVLGASANGCTEIASRLGRLGWTVADLASAQDAVPDVLVIDADASTDAVARTLARLSDAGATVPDRVPVLLTGSADALGRLDMPALDPCPRLTRPFDMSALVGALVGLMADSEELQTRMFNGSDAIAGGLRWLQGTHVLVVDDNELNREIVVELLRSQGATCEAFEQGALAVERIARDITGVDAVLMDVQMPIMDGLQATRAIRAQPDRQSLPIVALTAGALQSEREHALASGMDAFLTKPLEPASVVQVLRQLIRRYRGRGVDVAVNDSGPAVPAPAAEAGWPAIEGIDLAAARRHLDDNLPMFHRMLRLLERQYASWAADWLPRLGQLDQAGVAALCASLHKLRGSAATMGASGLADAAWQAEHALLGASAVHDTALVKAVGAQLDALVAALRPHVLPPAGEAPAPADPDALNDAMRDDLRDLLAMLAAQDLDALDELPRQRAALTAALGKTGAGALEAAVESLDFGAAHQALSEALGRTSAPAG